MNDNVHTLTDTNFEDGVLKSEQPVLVDYWAEGCGPCKALTPVLEEIANEYVGKLKVTKLRVDENPETPPKYGIRGVPTLMLFKDGEVIAMKIGAMSKQQLASFIDSHS